MTQGRTFTITKRALRRLRERAYRAQQKGDFEVCGAITSTQDDHLELDFLRNSSNSPGSFSLSNEDQRAARFRAKELGHRVVGWFHSHVVSEAVPGPRDIETAPTNSLVLIYDVCGLEARLWRVVRSGRGKAVTEQVLEVVDS